MNGPYLRHARVSFAVLGLATLGCGKSSPSGESKGGSVAAPRALTAEQRATIDGLVQRGQQRAKAIDLERHTALEKLGNAAPRLEAGACPYDPSKGLPPDPSTAETTNGKRTLAAKRQSYVLEATETVLPGKPPHTAIAAGQLDRALEPLRGKLAPGAYFSATDTPEKLVADAEKIVKELDEAHDLALVVTEITDPVADGASSFTPGRIAGVLHAWSRAKHAFVCATPVQGDGSGTVNITVFKGMGKADTTASALRGDLLTAAIIAHLGKLAPLAPQAASPAPPASAPKR